jgi:hypothetical protein
MGRLKATSSVQGPENAGPRKFGGAARKRPHAVCDRAFEAKKAGRDIRNMNAIEVP